MSALGQKQAFAAQKVCPLCSQKQTCRYAVMQSVRAHGVRRLLVYCNGKREGDWPCHHQGALPIEQFKVNECLRDRERRCTACGWRRADLRPDYGVNQVGSLGGGGMMPP